VATLTLGLSVPAVASQSRVASAWSPVKGISVIISDTTSPLTDAALTTRFEQVASYVKSLNANTISLNFAFSMTSMTSNDPHAGPETPSPQELANLIRIARGDGLNVQVRPALDETGWPRGQWRGQIAPTSLQTWFANYVTFLTPYLEASKLAGANDFVVGVELSSLLTDVDGWNQVVKAAHTIFGPNIQYSQSHNSILAVNGTEYGWDFYTQVAASQLSDGRGGTITSVAKLQSAMQTNLQTPIKDNGANRFPAPVPLSSTMLEEVGVPAISTGWQIPSITAADILLSPPVDRTFQANWFTAACNVMFANHMTGINYWALYIPLYTPGEDDSADYLLWSHTATETAIKACFARAS